MKKGLIFALVVVLTLALAGFALATVKGSKHDLGTGGGAPSKNFLGTGSGQVCVFCHHPHRGSSAGVANDLLWNMNSFSTTSFNVYNGSATFNATGSLAVTSSVPQSYLCMSCHDGNIAAGSLTQTPKDGTTAIANSITGSAALGTTLTDDHPVNFTYDSSLSTADPGIRTPSAVNVVSGTNVYPLYSTKMQCGTCHDVHAGTTSQDTRIQFMRGTTVGSQICIDCHINK